VKEHLTIPLLPLAVELRRDAVDQDLQHIGDRHLRVFTALPLVLEADVDLDQLLGDGLHHVLVALLAIRRRVLDGLVDLGNVGL